MIITLGQLKRIISENLNEELGGGGWDPYDDEDHREAQKRGYYSKGASKVAGAILKDPRLILDEVPIVGQLLAIGDVVKGILTLDGAAITLGMIGFLPWGSSAKRSAKLAKADEAAEAFFKQRGINPKKQEDLHAYARANIKKHHPEKLKEFDDTYKKAVISDDYYRSGKSVKSTAKQSKRAKERGYRSPDVGMNYDKATGKVMKIKISQKRLDAQRDIMDASRVKNGGRPMSKDEWQDYLDDMTIDEYTNEWRPRYNDELSAELKDPGFKRKLGSSYDFQMRPAQGDIGDADYKAGQSRSKPRNKR